MWIQPAPLVQIADALRSGDIDLLDYLEALLERLEMAETQLQAFVPEPERRARVLSQAAALQARYPDLAQRPRLYGVPVGIKDIFRVEGLPTRGGSALPPELFEAPEASVVSQLKAQGALVLGKTVTTEFAYFEPGPTRNPHNLAHTPGGSSSGSAAAVAAGLCLLAVGTQTIGSIIRPAAFCGVVGFKPSYNRIDPAGVIYCAPSLDHVGLFTQDVAGMQAAAALLCQAWKIDAADEPDGLPVLGVPDGPYLDQASPAALAAFEQQIGWLRAVGYVVKRVALFDDIAEIDFRHRELMAYEMAETHAEWFARYAEYYRPRTAEMIRKGQAVSPMAVQAAHNVQDRVRRVLDVCMRDAGVDIWISPAATGPAPEGLHSTGDPVMNLPWTHVGFPTVTVPAGRADNGLPLGLQCASAFGSDERLLAWAIGIERVFLEQGVSAYG
jgi:Asp-tRNA(Asn)/Glu-tRNA(Gln) amidotransferase A subunit family amidase